MDSPSTQDDKPASPLLIFIVGTPLLMLMLIGMALLVNYFPPYVLLIGVGGLAALGIGVKLKRMFFDAQTRTVEWLAALMFAGSLMVITKWLIPSKDSIVVVSFFILAVTWSFGGAAWGWHAAKRLNENDSRRRLWFIVAGWLAIPGTLAAIAFAVSFVAVMADTLRGLGLGTPINFSFVFLFGFVAMLAAPAWLIEHAARLYATRNTQHATRNTQHATPLNPSPPRP